MLGQAPVRSLEQELITTDRQIVTGDIVTGGDGAITIFSVGNKEYEIRWHKAGIQSWQASRSTEDVILIAILGGMRTLTNMSVRYESDITSKRMWATAAHIATNIILQMQRFEFVN